MGKKGKYTLDDFFRVTTEVQLPGRVVKVRALTDAESNIRKTYALEKSREAKRSLDIEEINKEISEMSREDIIDSIVMIEGMLALQRLYAETEPEIVIIPDDASLNERIDVADRRDEALSEWEKSIQERAEATREKIKKEVSKLKLDALSERISALVVEAKTRDAFTAAYEDMSICMSSDIVSKVEDVQKLNSQVRGALIAAINDVSGVDIWDMENFFGTDSSRAST